MVRKVNEKNHDEVVASLISVQSLDFGARGAACKKLEPIIEELSGEMAGKVVMAKIDVGGAVRRPEVRGDGRPDRRVPQGRTARSPVLQPPVQGEDHGLISQHLGV
ncbi:MAG: thioredoxin domain-containing protein [Candidatus Eisenbacteria bacterium]